MGQYRLIIASTLLLAVTFSPAHAASSQRNTQSYQLYSKGVEAVSKKRWDEAMKAFGEAIELNPSYVASYFEYARAAMLSGNRKLALEKLSDGLSYSKTKAERDKFITERDNLSTLFFTNETFQLYQNGLNYMKLDRGSSAIESLEKAKKIEGDNLLVLLAYADALVQSERQKEAVEALEKALLLNDRNIETRYKLADLLLAINPSRSAYLLKAYATSSTDERIVMTYARAISLSGKNEEAVSYLLPKVEKQQNWMRSHYWLGKFYSIDPKGAWNARKYLMIFIKRYDATQLPVASKDNKENDVESYDDRILKSWRADAGQLLERVNKSLE